jgi:hypothetical protein
MKFLVMAFETTFPAVVEAAFPVAKKTYEQLRASKLALVAFVVG